MGIQNLDDSLLLDFIKTIDSHLFEEIFSSPFTCSIIFRELSNLSKHIISRVLFIDETVRKSLISSWANKDYSEMLQKSLNELNDLRIFTSVSNGPQGECMRLNRRFQENLKCALFGGKQCDLVREYNDTGCVAEDPSKLLQNVVEKWESVLSLVAGITEMKSNSIAAKVVIQAGYVNNNTITNEGFQFLLLQKKKQVWQFLISYLESMKKGSIIVEILPLLFQIGYGSVNQVYTCSNPTSAHQEMLQHFLDFGFISSPYKQITRQRCIFQPTHLLIDLLSGNDRLCNSDTVDHSSVISSQGYIIMESSDLIYAVTNSKLQTAVLAMFCNVDKCFSETIVCHITGQSISRALETGITSDQIIAFLRNNGHPQMKDKSVVPITLVDKIKMVEYNRNRAKFIPGYLYHNFANPQEFDVIVNFAETSKLPLWKNRDTFLVMVIEDSHQSIKRFWKHRKNNDY